jgi:transposase
MAYSSDLSVEEFAFLEPLLPKKLRTRPPIWSKHQILNGIFYQLVNGCKWEDLPKDLPPTGTVFYWFNTWKKQGVWSDILQQVWVQSRLKQGKKRATVTTHIRLASS